MAWTYLMEAKMLNLAEFRAMLPNGGAFYASWPRTVTDADLRMVHAMLGATLEMWIDYLERRQAGDAEYASWFPGAQDLKQWLGDPANYSPRGVTEGQKP